MNRKLILLRSFATTILFVVLYFGVNLSLFIIFGQLLFHNHWLLFATAPLNFGEDFKKTGYPNTTYAALNGIIQAGDFWAPLVIIFFAELGEFILKTDYSVLRSYGLAVVASYLYSPVGLLVATVNQPIKGSSITGFCLLITYWFAKMPAVYVIKYRKVTPIPRSFVTWIFFFALPLYILGYSLILPGYAGQLNHYYGFVIFSILFLLWYSKKRVHKKKSIVQVT